MIERGSGWPFCRPSRLTSEQLLAHVEPAHEVRRDADLVQAGHDELGDPVVEDPLARDDALLARGGGIVLEILDERAGLGPLEEDLAAHDRSPLRGRRGTLARHQGRPPETSGAARCRQR
jgi:hypothetical protein